MKQNKEEKLPEISIVIIGMNEADNLDRTFQAAQNINYPKDKLEIIYCDTGSTDSSVQIAKKYISKVFVEKTDWPTPGLARNRGIEEVSFDIIHFMDGDIEMDKDYLKQAVKLMEEKDCEAVFGYLKERRNDINQILLSHWHDKEEGYVETSGGGGTYKKQALIEINGYDERIRKGQETEMGERFLKKGYKIWFAKIPMGIHDYGVSDLKSFLRIPYIIGQSVAYNALIKDNETDFIKQQKINNIKYLVYNIYFYVSILLGIFYTSIPLVIFVLFFLLRLVKSLYSNKPFKDVKSIIFRILNNFYMFWVFFGQLKVFYKIFIAGKIMKPSPKQILN